MRTLSRDELFIRGAFVEAGTFLSLLRGKSVGSETVRQKTGAWALPFCVWALLVMPPWWCGVLGGDDVDGGWWMS